MHIWNDVWLALVQSSLSIVIQNHEIVKTARILLFSIDGNTIYFKNLASYMIKKAG